MKKIVPFLMLAFCANFYGQDVINDYKYVVVPTQFESFKSPNQYKSSTLVKYLLAESKVNVLYSNQLPSELNLNRCLALYAKLKDDSNMFTTKITLILEDCSGKEVYTSIEGTSKQKEYDASYSEAIRAAMKSLSRYSYTYTGASSKLVEVSYQNDVKNLPTVQNKDEVVIATNAPIGQKVEPEAKEKASPVVEAQKVQSQENLYAQEILNGYQLVDSSPKIVMKILKTSQPNVFLAEETSGIKGSVYTKDGVWYFEYYEGEVLKVKSLNIKF
ncbi:hypothetical protein I2486_03360 [Cellulophaga sp. E16_2]|uniref:Uncharacterized protein n=1 Tax=Cellulophaga algicola (strain DSM 14237 / IC166 / ACAM 630) TaxID=688270 RepID=E6XCK1_CELAD|nr:MULTISPECIES: hypothetical protein [Cellulophaga]ADV47976.1 hypothetical protein Celal_0637 [Cellulophaga algicola DSM 14237]MBO0590436.1 hypothetical protein [Cellulophaga sp. E16_2]